MDHNHMDMSSTGMAMGTPTASGAMASSTGMSMGGPGSSCKISMLWNWYTVDSCFISKSWHVTSKGMFAGSCIGVILLVVLLEFLRRAGKEYDRYIISQHARSLVPGPASSASSDHDHGKTAATSAAAACTPVAASKFRPNVFQQAIRAFLHMAQFAVAYFIMLLAMYYNGYIIICIFIGAYIGYFVFGWESFNIGNNGKDRMEENVTVCCG